MGGGRSAPITSVVASATKQPCRRTALDAAFYRADVRKVEKDQANTVSKAADPGKFKDEQKWPEWESLLFVTYLSCVLGVSGVPLSYVVREKETPEAGVEYNSFNEQAIVCCPLVWPTFQANARKVDQLIKSFLQTETLEPFARHQNGRMDMETVYNHYSGDMNTSCRIAQAKPYRDTLYYKNEKSMSFSFLNNMQRMFNIFQEENEIISEQQAKVRMLLKKSGTSLTAGCHWGVLACASSNGRDHFYRMC
jgi:hypothetical protein